MRVFFFFENHVGDTVTCSITTIRVHGSGLLNIHESFLCRVVRYYVIYRCYVHDVRVMYAPNAYTWNLTGEKTPPKTIERFLFCDGPLSRRHNNKYKGWLREINDRELCENRSRKSPPRDVVTTGLTRYESVWEIAFFAQARRGQSFLHVGQQVFRFFFFTTHQLV